jgi:hypothetical protein
VTCILDLLHVMERLWKAAWCLFDEGTQKAEAERWVEDRLRMLLEGKVGRVIGGLRQTLTKRKLKGSRRKTVREVISYFDRNRCRMRYDEYLAAGYPIGSGVIEGGVSASGEGSPGAGGDAMDPRRCPVDARPASDLPQRGVGGILGLPCGAGGRPTLQESQEDWVRADR